KGWAYGAVLDQILYDFGRISSKLEQAKAERSLGEARLAQEKLRFLTTMGGLYLGCAKVRSLTRLNEDLMVWAKILLTETSRFARPGQRSIGDRSLVESEISDLDVQREELRKFEATLIGQMKTYAPISSCQRLRQAWDISVADGLRVEDPTMLAAKAQLELS